MSPKGSNPASIEGLIGYPLGSTCRPAFPSTNRAISVAITIEVSGIEESGSERKLAWRWASTIYVVRRSDSLFMADS